jgi:hypothetical protein
MLDDLAINGTTSGFMVATILRALDSLGDARSLVADLEWEADPETQAKLAEMRAKMAENEEEAVQ